jgi:serine/threonine protein kinase
MNKMYDFVSSKVDPETEFDLIELIGQGNYGKVYKALHKKTGKIYAAKIANIGTCNEIESFKKEINVLSQCDSPYIVHYFGSYIKNYQIWIILEYCDGGSLLELINILPKSLNEEQIASLVNMMLLGLNFLHENKKIHRDVKTGNILLTRVGIAKLGDFGVSTQLMHSFSKKISKIGTPFYMSPEVIMQNRYNYKCDIWSLGITIIEMAEGEPPFAKVKPYLVLKKIITQPPTGLKNKEKWSQEFNDFVSKCLIFEPNDRPSAKELLNHPFIVKNNRGNKLISELINNCLDDLAYYRKKILECDEEENEEDDENEKNYSSSNNNNNYENTEYNPDNMFNDNSNSVIIKDDDDNNNNNINSQNIIESINLDNKNNNTNKKINYSINNEDDLQSININHEIESMNSVNIIDTGISDHNKNNNNNNNNNNDNPIMQVINMGLDGLSFDLKENPDKTIKAEETKISESHTKTKNNLQNSFNFNKIINDSSVNNLTKDEIKLKLKNLENEMNIEILNIKEKYKKKMEKYKLSLKFLEENHFLKNINEYKDYTKFRDKIKKRVKDNTKITNGSSCNLGSNSTIKPNHILVFDYKENNISLKNKLKYDE